MAQRPSADDQYGSYGSVSAGPGNSPEIPTLGVRANADAFGGQVGEALSRAGAATEKFGNDQMKIEAHLEQQATEGKEKDNHVDYDYPKVMSERKIFDAVPQSDKVHGYERYITNLRKIRDEGVASSPTQYGKEIRRNLIDSLITKETEYGMNALAESNSQLNVQANIKLISTLGDDNLNNYNNPARVADNFSRMDAAAEMSVIDSGIDPNTPDFHAAVQEAQRTARGTTVVGMVNRAINSGDVSTAAQIYDDHKHVVPGYQQLAIDSAIAIQGNKQTASAYSEAIVQGRALPEPIAAPARQVQAAVVNAAHNAGVDYNQALTVARIESSYGQNVGKRGDIGQTGKGGDIHEQSSNMITALKEAHGVAEKSLGRPPEQWETYAVYQQGIGAGPALFSSASGNPNERAIDAIAPLYKSRDVALTALTNNGGNATMTSGQFLDFLKKKYETNYKAAHCEFPKTDTGTTGMGPPEQGGISTGSTLLTSGNRDYGYGQRSDGTQKGPGFLGELKNSNGDVSTELSIGVEIDGKEVEVPSLVPTLTKDEVQWMLDNKPPTEDISRKAAEFAKNRIASGKSPFADESDLVKNKQMPGDLILKQGEEQGITIQPGATPRQALDNFDQGYPILMARAEKLLSPNDRDGVIKELNRQRANLVSASSAYTGQIIKQATQIGNDPNFTDVSQVPAEIQNAILQDNPQTWQFLEGRAAYNAKKGSGQISEDMKKYGSGYYDAFRKIVNHEINSPTELYKFLPDANGEGGTITFDGYDKLMERFAKDPKSQAQEEMRKNLYENLKKQISNERPGGRGRDEQGEQNWASAMPMIDSAIQQGLKDGKTWGDLTDPKSKDYVGNAVKSLFKTPTQAAVDANNPATAGQSGFTGPFPNKSMPENMLGPAKVLLGNSWLGNKIYGSDNPGTEAEQFNNYLVRIRQTTDPAEKEKLMLEAKKKGLIPKDLYAIPANVKTSK